LTPICTKSFVGWGFAPLTAPPGPLAVFRGPTSKGGGEGEKREMKGRGEEKGGEQDRGGKEFVLCHRKKKEKSAPVLQFTSGAVNKR